MITGDGDVPFAKAVGCESVDAMAVVGWAILSSVSIGGCVATLSGCVRSLLIVWRWSVTRSSGVESVCSLDIIDTTTARDRDCASGCTCDDCHG